MEKNKNINQPQGPRRGNTGDMSKVAKFHSRHAYAQTLADAVNRQFSNYDSSINGVGHSRDLGRKMPK